MKEIAKAISIGEDGMLTLNMCCDEANGDFLRAARLSRAADAGDKKAAKELDRRLSTKMVREVDEGNGFEQQTVVSKL